ncbi:BFD-like [2Fe-2S] binding domain-containing protein [Bradyrhizobium shewense]|uniref:BFD-like [2Fe-2S] binding domain-containing protein n=1 Tax=Bradyrhizobium shewense TaxID=1761772 RepID=A0A1C3UQQ2_9BRAD|nr:BFD-like [2Fe-2S] binding domain-containing protein [Bradyrhizobium shewense]
MIICSCNVLSDHDVRHAVNTADNAQRNAKQIYDCLGCSAECGRCARTMQILDPLRIGQNVKEIIEATSPPR